MAKTMKEAFLSSIVSMFPDVCPFHGMPVQQHSDLIRVFGMGWSERIIAEGGNPVAELGPATMAELMNEEWVPDDSWKWWLRPGLTEAEHEEYHRKAMDFHSKLPGWMNPDPKCCRKDGCTTPPDFIAVVKLDGASVPVKTMVDFRVCEKHARTVKLDELLTAKFKKYVTRSMHNAGLAAPDWKACGVEWLSVLTPEVEEFMKHFVLKGKGNGQPLAGGAADDRGALPTP